MGDQELVLPADIVRPLASLYWLFPFSKYEPSARHPDRLRRVPLPPRPAPRRQIEAAAALLGRPIPDWVVALWCCRVYLAAYHDQEAGQLGRYVVEVDRAAHEAGAPTGFVFFAGSASLYPGTTTSCGRGRAGTTFVKGALDHFVYGFEPAAELAGEPPRLIRYLHTAGDPERRLQRLDLAEYLADCEREALGADDSDVFSKEAYAGIVALRDAKRPPFRLLWETSTPTIAPDPKVETGPGQPTTASAPVQVMHKTFGLGTVLARQGSCSGEKLTVAFAEGTRVVLARFVEPVVPTPDLA